MDVSIKQIPTSFIYFTFVFVMVEVWYRWSSQKTMSASAIQQLKRRMKRSTQRLPLIQKVEEKTEQKEKKSAEQQLEKFLNS